MSARETDLALAAPRDNRRPVRATRAPAPVAQPVLIEAAGHTCVAWWHAPAAPASPLAVDALALWSGSRLAFAEWAPALHRLRGLRVELLHGRDDANLGIAAGHSLRDALAGAGAQVRWLPFDGGHEIPPQAWLGLRRLVRELGASVT